LSGLDILPADAEALIRQARLKLGWIEAPSEEPEGEAETETETETEETASEGGATQEAR
jgi:hypothetical protein